MMNCTGIVCLHEGPARVRVGEEETTQGECGPSDMGGSGVSISDQRVGKVPGRSPRQKLCGVSSEGNEERFQSGLSLHREEMCTSQKQQHEIDNG